MVFWCARFEPRNVIRETLHEKLGASMIFYQVVTAQENFLIFGQDRFCYPAYNTAGLVQCR
tara:strand:+ start:1026 stop:1208 length:183 start_codon:yes stop_codon:yes gene_type:complete